MNGMEKEIVEVALDDIIPNRFQPRLSFDENGLNELAESIRQHGIIQPLVLRKVADKYEIIAGERRYKAAYIAGLTKVPAVIINLNDNESAEVAIVENIQRRNLSPIEEAKSYKKLLDRGYLTQDQLAGRMGKTQATISNKLRLLNLDEKVQDALLNNKISERHARSLLRVEDKEEQRKLLDEIINNRLNVRDTEELINRKLGKVTDNFIPVNGLSNLNQEKETNNVEEFMEFPKFVQEPKIEEPKLQEPLLEQNSSESKVDVNDFFTTDLPKVEEKKEERANFMNSLDEVEEIETLPDFKEEDIKENVLPFNLSENKDINLVVEKVKNTEAGVGFNALTEEYIDMVKAGIVDPAKVTRSALQNAASIASLVLTTETIVADKVDENAAVPSMPPMGGMGGMM